MFVHPLSTCTSYDVFSACSPDRITLAVQCPIDTAVFAHVYYTVTMSSPRMQLTQLVLHGLLLSSFVLMPVAVSAQTSHIFDDSGTGATIVKSTGLGAQDPTKIAMSIANSVLGFVAVIVFCLMVYGSIIWMMARGDPKEVTRAKDIMKAAITGLFFVLAAWGITLTIASALNKAVVAPSATGDTGSTGDAPKP